jgi:hypothetical protein
MAKERKPWDIVYRPSRHMLPSSQYILDADLSKIKHDMIHQIISKFWPVLMLEPAMERARHLSSDNALLAA